jgi:hypothetical protein
LCASLRDEICHDDPRNRRIFYFFSQEKIKVDKRSLTLLQETPQGITIIKMILVEVFSFVDLLAI